MITKKTGLNLGYSAYAASKFALRGLSEVLSMELEPHGIHIQIAYPPDTDTPGYKQENLGKPTECFLISAESGLWDPQVIGEKMVTEALKQNLYHVYFGLDGWFLSTLCSGMSPFCRSLFENISQVCLMGFLRFISFFYLKKFSNIIFRSRKRN